MNRRQPSIHDTPSRGPAKNVSFGTQTSQSVIKGRSSLPAFPSAAAIAATPSRPKLRDPRENQNTECSDVFATPLKRKTPLASPNEANPNSPERHKGSIYDALGWDDDVDDLA